MTDINRRLQLNSINQKQAKQAAEYLELDRQGKEIEERGQVRILKIGTAVSDNVCELKDVRTTIFLNLFVL